MNRRRVEESERWNVYVALWCGTLLLLVLFAAVLDANAQSGPPDPPGVSVGVKIAGSWDPADPETWPDWTWKGLEENWLLLGVPDPHNVLTDWWAYPGGPGIPFTDEITGLNEIQESILFTGFLNANAAHATARAARDALALAQLNVNELDAFRKEFLGFRQDDFPDFWQDQNILLGAANSSLDNAVTKLTSIDGKLTTTNSTLSTISSGISTSNTHLNTISGRVNLILTDTTAIKNSAATIVTNTGNAVSQLGTANTTLDGIATSASGINSKLSTTNARLQELIDLAMEEGELGLEELNETATAIKADTAHLEGIKSNGVVANTYLFEIRDHTAGIETIAEGIKGLLEDGEEPEYKGGPVLTPESEVTVDAVTIPEPELDEPKSWSHWYSQIADTAGTEDIPNTPTWGQSMSMNPPQASWSFNLPAIETGFAPGFPAQTLSVDFSWFESSGWRLQFMLVILFGLSLWALRFVWLSIRKQ